MDLNMARQILRISPDTPLTAQLIETAHASESWARHPSRYPDAAGRHQAEEWSTKLDEARASLLASDATTTVPPAAAETARAPRRGLRPWAITGIVAGVAVFVALITFGAFGAAGLITETMSAATDALEAGENAASEDSIDSADSETTELADVERYFSGETLYSFPAALEIYNDGRYDVECSFDFAYGCWEMALFTESDCTAMQVELVFSNDPDAFEPEHTQTIDVADVLGNEATVVVFGNDGYDFGWINDVMCLDAVS
ncbi:hypothetical protein J7E25_07105 [Agromyces sp. ISL-38]|uniref:hypothetical protein n=1 Tax=Agromyces sp. ISL-38 TaxID=2819107 RepID=UPI001BEBCB6F|nr:hypothetical protein [Agromyces sp. ISL-38]MBT2498860.1 hypothetical protein [Agromyces sp. ISL-38]